MTYTKGENIDKCFLLNEADDMEVILNEVVGITDEDRDTLNTAMSVLRGIADHFMEGQKEAPKEILERLEYLRKEIEAERISYGEIAELQSLAEYIDHGDVLLLQWAGIPEFNDQ